MMAFIETKSPAEIARVFGCTEDQARTGLIKNIAVLRGMHSQALRTGKKVNGYTAEKLAARIASMEAACAR